MRKINLEKIESLADVFYAVMGGEPESIREIEAFMADNPLKTLIHSSDIERVVEYDGFFAEDVADAVYALLPVKLRIAPHRSVILLPQTFRKLNAQQMTKPVSRCIDVSLFKALDVIKDHFNGKIKEVVAAVQEAKQGNTSVSTAKVNTPESAPASEKKEEKLLFSPVAVIKEKKAANPNFGKDVMRDSVDSNKSLDSSRRHHKPRFLIRPSVAEPSVIAVNEVKSEGGAEQQKKEIKPIEKKVVAEPKVEDKAPKKRGRKPKGITNQQKKEVKPVEKKVVSQPKVEDKAPKKRGRKPKGIINQQKKEVKPVEKKVVSQPKVEDKTPKKRGRKPKNGVTQKQIKGKKQTKKEITVNVSSVSKKNKAYKRTVGKMTKVQLLKEIKTINDKLQTENLTAEEKKKLKMERNRFQTAKYRLEHPDAWKKHYKKLSELPPEKQQQRREGNRQRNVVYRDAHREELRASHNARRARLKEENPELVRELDRQHNITQSRKEAGARYYQRHKEKLAQKARENPMVKVYKQRYQRKKRLAKTGPMIMALLQGIIQSK